MNLLLRGVKDMNEKKHTFLLIGLIIIVDILDALVGLNELIRVGLYLIALIYFIMQYYRYKK